MPVQGEFHEHLIEFAELDVAECGYPVSACYHDFEEGVGLVEIQGLVVHEAVVDKTGQDEYHSGYEKGVEVPG